ncbi:hypothetical protein AGMMS49921_07350 [Endomicrobiia bacterium]|nr:hypothetical protein AGMMS49921_07300 [Endomicrobiia bacterium]GHT42364.1 hypothetical protein AGMMS49921_07350 [Endomicrobiia bacterium]
MTNKTEGAQLILNGVFTHIGCYSRKKDSYDNINNYPIHKALQNVWQLILSQGQTIPDNNFPLMLQIKNIKKPPKITMLQLFYLKAGHRTTSTLLMIKIQNTTLLQILMNS